MLRNLWYLFSSGRNFNEQLLRLQPMIEIQQFRATAPHQLQNMNRTREHQQEDMAGELNFRRRASVFGELDVAVNENMNLAVSDTEHLTDSDDEDDELYDLLNTDGQICPKRRGAHTMPRYGVDEHVTQPILWLALEQLRKHENEQKRKLQTGGSVACNENIDTPADFVANYLIKNMNLEIFNDGNQPRYGPGPLSRRPRRTLRGLLPT